MPDLADFWSTDALEDQHRSYIEAPPTPEVIASVEAELGHRLPASYIELMRVQNGGLPRRTCHPTAEPTSWAEDHVAISGLMGIGREKTYSLCGSLGSQFMIDEWGYPALGVYFGECPSAGHDMVALDYRACGPQGEPCVVHVDQEHDYRVTWLAPDFATFVRGLQPEEAFAEDPEEVRQGALNGVLNAPFSPELQTLLDAYPDADLPVQVRALAARIVQDKGFFALHADAPSSLMYDAQFLLFSHSHAVRDPDAYLDAHYPDLIAMTGAATFGTGGYAPDFLRDWWADAVQQGRVARAGDGWRFTEAAERQVRAALAEA